MAVASSACGDSDSNHGSGGVGGDGAAAGSGAGSGGHSGSGASTDGGMGAADSAGAAGTPAAAGQGAGGLVAPYAMASTASGTCALDAQGAIHCWGLAPEVWAVPQGSFVELHGSTNVVCGIRDDRTVACFAQPGGVQDLTFVPEGKVQHVAVGLGAICGIDDGAEPFCDWTNQAFAIPVPAGEHFKTLSVGSQFGCGIRDADKSILCWGSPGSEECPWVPEAGQLEAPSGSFSQIASGTISSCAVRTDGELACWGAGEANDDPDALCREQRFNFGQSSPPPGQYRSVSVSSNHACGIRADGTVACWGAGTSDDCPDTGVDCRQSRPPATKFEQVSTGAFHTCAMTSERRVECWGYDGAGDGRTTPPVGFR